MILGYSRAPLEKWHHLTPGTPEYDAIMGILSRFRLLFGALNVKVDGKPADLYRMLEKTIGHYGVSDYNAKFRLK